MNRFDRIASLLVAENSDYIQQANDCVLKLMPAVALAYYQVTGAKSPRGTMNIQVRVGDDELPEGKVGSFQLPDGQRDYGILTVRSGCFCGEKTHYWWVVAHELIHAFLGKSSEYHNEQFRMMADALGIPEQYASNT